MVQSDMCAQQGTALLHTEIFSRVWEMELSGCLSGSYISLVSTEKRQNRWEKEMKRKAVHLMELTFAKKRRGTYTHHLKTR